MAIWIYVKQQKGLYFTTFYKSQSKEFQTLPEDRLVDSISRDELFVKSEDEMRFESMIISSFDSLH